MTYSESESAVKEKKRDFLVKGIIDSALKMMERIIRAKNPKNCARDLCRDHKQSKTEMTRNTAFFNILTGVQRLPARPRDFRINFATEEKNILESELSDILTSLVHRNFLDPKRDKFPYPKGRPKSDTDISGLAKERRGAFSYYTQSEPKKIIDEILRDSKCIRSIDNAILTSKLFEKFLEYCFEVYLHQMKENQPAFLNTMKPAISKYGLGYKSLEELDGSYIFAKDLTPEKIKRFAKGYAINTVNNFQQDGKNILYTVAGLFSLLDV